MDLLALLGVIAFVVGLLLSIALHEIGHLLPAKLFGVKVTQYMVGFGRTIWSRRRGETEYGIKSIPLGGYVRMIGMFPPAPGDDPNTLRQASTGPFQSLIEDARTAAKEEIGPGDEDRVFYRKAWPKKLIVMLGGPMMNVVIAFVLAAGVLFIYGNTEKPILTPTVASVSECVIPASEGRFNCTESDPVAPAAEAGLEPGDRIISVDGVAIGEWSDAQHAIRDRAGEAVPIVVERPTGEMGRPETVSLTATLMASERPTLDSTRGDVEYVTVGFLGVSPEILGYEKENIVGAVGWIGGFTGIMAEAVVNIPQKMVGVVDAAFGGGERDPEGPVGIVGAGRIGGEIASLDEVPASARVASFVMMLASFNLAIAFINLVPLLPLDGGHAAGAIWEGIKRGWARLARRPMPRPVDVAKGLPVAYAMAGVLLSMALLLLYADIVNPITLSG